MANSHNKKKWAAKLWHTFINFLSTFGDPQIGVGAASLTYYTLLSLVPILAFFLGFAKGFLDEKTFTEWLTNNFIGDPRAIEQLITISKRSLEQTHNSVIVGVGAALYLWAGVRLLSRLEYTMNEIWEVSEERPFLSKVTDYIALFFLAPLLAAISISMTAYFSGTVAQFEEQWSVFFLINTLPFVLTWVLCTFIFIYIPNTPVRFYSAMLSGLMTALFFEALQWVYVNFQAGLSSYNTIYGTLVAIPLLLMWINLSWTLLLVGARTTFLIQNSNAYDVDHHTMRVAHKEYLLLCLYILHYCAQKWVEESTPPTDEEISADLFLPISISNKILHDLSKIGLLVEVLNTSRNSRTFQIGANLEMLTLGKVIERIDAFGEKPYLPDNDELKKIRLKLDEFHTLVTESSSNCLIKDLL